MSSDSRDDRQSNSQQRIRPCVKPRSTLVLEVELEDKSTRQIRITDPSVEVFQAILDAGIHTETPLRLGSSEKPCCPCCMQDLPSRWIRLQHFDPLTGEDCENIEPRYFDAAIPGQLGLAKRLLAEHNRIASERPEMNKLLRLDWVVPLG